MSETRSLKSGEKSKQQPGKMKMTSAKGCSVRYKSTSSRRREKKESGTWLKKMLPRLKSEKESTSSSPKSQLPATSLIR